MIVYQEDTKKSSLNLNAQLCHFIKGQRSLCTFISCKALTTHPCVYEQLHCSYILAIVNDSAVNTEVHISFWIRVFIFSGCIFRSGIAGSYDSSIFRFWGTSILFSKVAVQQFAFPTVYEGFLFSTSIPTFVIYGLLIIAILTSVRYISLWFWFAFL